MRKNIIKSNIIWRASHLVPVEAFVLRLWGEKSRRMGWGKARFDLVVVVRIGWRSRMRRSRMRIMWTMGKGITTVMFSTWLTWWSARLPGGRGGKGRAQPLWDRPDTLCTEPGWPRGKEKWLSFFRKRKVCLKYDVFVYRTQGSESWPENTDIQIHRRRPCSGVHRHTDTRSGHLLGPALWLMIGKKKAKSTKPSLHSNWLCV